MLLDHPSIQDCAVVGVPDEDVGELPRAYVVLKAGKNASAIEIQNFVKGEWIRYCTAISAFEFGANLLPQTGSLRDQGKSGDRIPFAHDFSLITQGSGLGSTS